MIVCDHFYDDVLELISKKTGAKVHKRQAEELVQRYTTIAKMQRATPKMNRVWLNCDARKQITFS